MKKILLQLFIFGYIFVLFNKTIAQTVEQQPNNFNENTTKIFQTFYISSIFDERAVPDSIGKLFFSSSDKQIARKITLENGTLKGLTKILRDSDFENTALKPIIIRIKECNIKEVLLPDKRIEGEVNILLMFDLDQESGTVPLTQYRSTAKYTRSLSNLNIVEPALRKVLGNSLEYINSWIKLESNNNPALARGLKLKFHDYLEQHEDTVYYHPSRPLIWDDFREKRSGNKFVASVFPSFGYDQHTKIENGIITVEMVLKVFVVKSASWVSPGSSGNYNLKHEQKHFDLVKIIAERFKKKLLTEKLTPDNYQGIINFEYLEFYREMNKIQKEYDEQTSHGASATMQEFWNRKIASELRMEN